MNHVNPPRLHHRDPVKALHLSDANATFDSTAHHIEKLTVEIT